MVETNSSYTLSPPQSAETSLSRLESTSSAENQNDDNFDRNDDTTFDQNTDDTNVNAFTGSVFDLHADRHHVNRQKLRFMWHRWLKTGLPLLCVFAMAYHNPNEAMGWSLVQVLVLGFGLFGFATLVTGSRLLRRVVRCQLIFCLLLLLLLVGLRVPLTPCDVELRTHLDVRSPH